MGTFQPLRKPLIALLFSLSPLGVWAVAEPAAKPPLISPARANQANSGGLDELVTVSCHNQFARGIPSIITLEIDFRRRTVNETPALISPIEIQWIRINSRGLSTYYRLNRYSGTLEGKTARQLTRVTGHCDPIPNR